MIVMYRNTSRRVPDSAVRTRRGKPAALMLVILALGSVFVGFQRAAADSQDFPWDLSRALLFKQDPYELYARWLLEPRMPRPFLARSIEPQYPASSLAFLWPVAALPWNLAKIVWAGIAVGCSLAASYVLNRRYLGGERLTTMCLASTLLASVPARAAIGNGQSSLLAFAAIVLAMDQADRHRHRSAVLLAISWIKYHLTFPLTLALLYRGQWRIVLEAMLIHVCLLLLLSAWLPRDPVELLLAPLSFIGPQVTEGFIDVFAVLGRFGVSGVWASLCSVGLLLGVSAIVARQRDASNELVVLSVLSILACVWVYHRIYDLVVLLIPLCYVVASYNHHHAVGGSKSRGALAWLSSVMILTTWFLLGRTVEAKLTNLLGATAAAGIYYVAVFGTYGAIAVGALILLRGPRPLAGRTADGVR